MWSWVQFGAKMSHFETKKFFQNIDFRYLCLLKLFYYWTQFSKIPPHGFLEPSVKGFGTNSRYKFSFGNKKGFFQNIDHCHFPILIVPYHCAEIQKNPYVHSKNKVYKVLVPIFDKIIFLKLFTIFIFVYLLVPIIAKKSKFKVQNFKTIHRIPFHRIPFYPIPSSPIHSHT